MCCVSCFIPFLRNLGILWQQDSSFKDVSRAAPSFSLSPSLFLLFLSSLSSFSPIDTRVQWEKKDEFTFFSTNHERGDTIFLPNEKEWVRMKRMTVTWMQLQSSLKRPLIYFTPIFSFFSHSLSLYVFHLSFSFLSLFSFRPGIHAYITVCLFDAPVNERDPWAFLLSLSLHCEL